MSFNRGNGQFWNVVTLGELADGKIIWLKGGFPSGVNNESGDGAPHIRPFNVSTAGDIEWRQVKYVPEPDGDNPCWVRPGDVIFNNTNSEDLVGKTALFNEDKRAVISNHMTLIRPLDQESMDGYWLSRYLHRLWEQRVFKNLCRRYVGQASVDLSRLRSVEISLPPIDEQRTIASALRSIQEARDASRRELELERERKAALMEDLFTKGLRGEPQKQTEIGPIPKSWQVAALGECLKFAQYGTSEKCDADPSAMPVLRIPNVIGGAVDIRDLKYIDLPAKVSESLRLEKGDLLFVRTNGNRDYAGRCAMYSEQLPTALFASYLIRARVDSDRLLPHFVQFYTMTRSGKSFLSGRASNAADGKFNINTQTIKGVRVPIPSLVEQRDITKVLVACDHKIAALQTESVLLDELFRVLLDDLMTGRVSALPLVAK